MSTTVPDLELIRSVPLFAGLTQHQAGVLFDMIVRRKYKKGDEMVVQGARSDTLFIILSGRAHVVSGHERLGEVILDVLRAGDHFGEMSLIDNQTHSASVRADSDMQVLTLGRHEFALSLPANNSMAFSVLKSLVRRLRRANLNIESLALMDVYGRIAKTLLDMAALDDHGNHVVHDKVSRLTLARMVGASRETVSRALADIIAQGFIELRPDGSMLIKDSVKSFR
ncbi:MAG: Crp/Fnr family transcriptional regulator [Polaromonas sp.]|nr:Crp/Fnr family transcriptional regulator [Polaromonas sp.]